MKCACAETDISEIEYITLAVDSELGDVLVLFDASHLHACQLAYVPAYVVS